MLIQDLVVKLGAPNEAALSAAMDSFGLTIDDLNNSPDYQNSLTDFFSQASAIATTETAAPVKAKRGRKALKNVTEDKAKSANDVGKAQMELVTKKIETAQVANFKEYAKELTISADKQSDAIAAIALAYPGFVDQMAAEKIDQGLNNQTPGFRGNIQSSNPDDALQEAIEDLGLDFELAYEVA